MVDDHRWLQEQDRIVGEWTRLGFHAGSGSTTDQAFIKVYTAVQWNGWYKAEVQFMSEHAQALLLRRPKIYLLMKPLGPESSPQDIWNAFFVSARSHAHRRIHSRPSSSNGSTTQVSEQQTTPRAGCC